MEPSLRKVIESLERAEVEKLSKDLTPRQRRVINKLAGLTRKERELRNKISKVMKRKPGVYLDTKTGALELCEDRDDKLVTTLGTRAELRRVKSRIKYVLREAIGLGMERFDVIRAMASMYGLKDHLERKYG